MPPNLGRLFLHLLEYRWIHLISQEFSLIYLALGDKNPQWVGYNSSDEKSRKPWERLTSVVYRNILDILQPIQLDNMKGHGAVP